MGGIVDGRLRWGPEDRTRGPWIRRRDGAGLILQAAGVGGTTLHFNGIMPRAYPSAMEGDWPFPYHDLVPYYERVEEFLPVSLVTDLATKDALLASGCEGIGLERSETKEVHQAMWRPCHNAILSIAKMVEGGPLRYPEVDGCTMCGHCLVGCPNPVGAPLERKAKRATNVSYVPAAMATGNCEIVPDAFATAILHEPRRAAMGPQASAILLAGAGNGFWDEPTAGEPWDFAGRWWGQDAIRRVDEYHRSLSIVVCTDDETTRDSYVTLADDWGPDENGPVPKVVYRPTATSWDRQHWLARKGAEILRAAGAREVHRTRFTPLLTHLMSTMRMGTDPATSVVDPDGQAHEGDPHRRSDPGAGAELTSRV
jgi:choline dehydrogenase-like flavoprotein